MSEFKIAIGRGPTCPNCGWDGFDDWWLDKSCRSGHGPVVDIYANLECECGSKFEVTRYHDGETHSVSNTPALREGK
jgi:hypothetical protein